MIGDHANETCWILKVPKVGDLRDGATCCFDDEFPIIDQLPSFIHGPNAVTVVFLRPYSMIQLRRFLRGGGAFYFIPIPSGAATSMEIS